MKIVYALTLVVLKDDWLEKIKTVLEEATLRNSARKNMDAKWWKKGIHTEHLGYILAEMQFLQRAYPGLNGKTK